MPSQSNTLVALAQSWSPEPIGDDPEIARTAMLALLRGMSTHTDDVLESIRIVVTPGRRRNLNAVKNNLIHHNDGVEHCCCLQSIYDLLARDPSVGTTAGSAVFEAMYPAYTIQYLDGMNDVHHFVRNGFEIAIQTWLLRPLTGIRV